MHYMKRRFSRVCTCFGSNLVQSVEGFTGFVSLRTEISYKVRNQAARHTRKSLPEKSLGKFFKNLETMCFYGFISVNPQILW